MSGISNPTREAARNAETIYKGQKSILVMVIGKSGRGKSHAIMHLPKDKTHIINVIGKPLPFPTGMQYIPGENMTVTPDTDKIRRVMKELSSKGEVDHIVIDDSQYIMATEFMDKALVKGYDKFTMMARNIWEILILSTKLRAGLKVFFLTHEEETPTERKMKTLGKLLDDKITPEGLSTIVLFADVADKQGTRHYYFSTQSDGITNAKSPYDMFPQQIPNDLQLIASRIDEYYSGTPLKATKCKFDL